MDTTDAVVIGAGVVGLAVARALARDGREVVVLEAADAIGTGQSSRNSEVIHAGLYYPSDWLKTRLCTAGREALYRFCAERGVTCRKTGKLVVATSPDELPSLEALAQQARANGVPVEPLDRAAVGALEPAVVAEAGLYSAESGILDSHELMLALQADLDGAGGVVALGSPVTAIAPGPDGAVVVRTEDDAELAAGVVVNAAGLGAQAVARATQGMPDVQVPSLQLMKGHYFMLTGRSPFRHLVYPLPGPNSLGLHVTHDLSGRARFGPDAVPVDRVDYGFDEGRLEAFVQGIRRYWPAVEADRLTPAYTGIRAQLAHGKGERRDFVISGPGEHLIPGLWHLFGFESPALTASLAIGEFLASKVREGA
jgi:L-2-hydroxyglutarate oxidase LhgO